MSEVKSTPGPWKVRRRSAGEPYKVDAGALGIASVWGGDAVAEANAHLIAAAPELYDALKLVITFCRMRELTAAQQRAIGAAIAKSEGRTP